MSGGSRWARLRRLLSMLLGLPDHLARQSRDLDQLGQGLERVGQRLDRVEQQLTALAGRVDLETTMAALADAENQSRRFAHQMDDSMALLRVTEARSQHLAHQLDDALELLHATEARTGTLLDHAVRAALTSDFIVSQQHAAYIEASERLTVRERSAAVAARSLVLEAVAPIALDSADHLSPESTEEGVVRPVGFVAHCRRVLGSRLACLDLGTGGAGLVYEFVMQDVLAIGLDGSDHNQRLGRGYWPVLPDNLRTCDVTRSFILRQADGRPFRFPLVTAWEMLEHIPESLVPGLLSNVRDNLAPDGWFVGSVSLREYVGGDGQPYHVTLRPREWWAERFAEAGLEIVDGHPFDVRSFPRGNGPHFQDFHNYCSMPTDGFHFVAQHRTGVR